MSKYTTELRYICETLAGKDESVGYDSVDEVITSALPLLFNFDFPIYDEAYRAVLERKIVMHYYKREICAETVGLWKLYLQTKLNEIMPYYNQLYLSALIEYNPLYDVDLKRNHSKTGTEAGSGTNTGNASYSSEKDSTNSDTSQQAGSATRTDAMNESNSNSGTDSNTHYDLYSDTPNNKLSNVDELDYLTNLRKVTDSGANSANGSHTSNETITDATANSTNRSGSENVDETGSSSNSSSYNNSLNTTENYIETVVGSSGGYSYAKRIAEFRKNILNIDMMIINDLESLFFGLW